MLRSPVVRPVRRRVQQWCLLVLFCALLVALSAQTFRHGTSAGVYPASRMLLSSDDDADAQPKGDCGSYDGSDGTYPAGLFGKMGDDVEGCKTKERLRNGAVFLHVIGLLYMFIALAIVCDSYFVPALEVIIERFDITEDVAGATFMAAGGSAPELFTSIIGVFLAKSNVGFGTIVGSAVFNVLFVIGMCAIASKELLALTWWPLARDTVFYSLDLVVLALFVNSGGGEDGRGLIQWWKALCLLLLYCMYVTFMKYNEVVEETVKGCLDRMRNRSATPKSPNKPNRQATHMVVTVNENEGGEMDTPAGGTEGQSGHRASVTSSSTSQQPRRYSIKAGGPLLRRDSVAAAQMQAARDAGKEPSEVSSPPEPVWEPKWPAEDSIKDKIWWLAVWPLHFLLWITLPDMNIEEKKRFFAGTFLGSILWIGCFSYFMVWWATVVGFTLSIPPTVMGLTVLAAGTSVPDLITSVIVARQGNGDMAVSSSIGSNIFDITFGLPVPWLLYAIIEGEPVEVGSTGTFFSVILLFGMLVSIITIIALSGWKMTKRLGAAMFALYGVFLALSLMREYEVIEPGF